LARRIVERHADIFSTFLAQPVVSLHGGNYLSPTFSKSNHDRSHGSEGFRLNSDDSSG
jgi:hypothetical protein